MKINFIFSISLLILASCNSVEKSPTTDTAVVAVPEAKSEAVYASDSDKTASVKASEPTRPAEKSSRSTNWTYDTAKDKTPSATVLSLKSLALKAPNDGVNPGKLIIMKNHYVTNLIVALSKGKFIVEDNGKSIRAKFDGSDFETYDCTKSNNGDLSMLFVDNSDKFIKKLKAAKLVTVEADVEHNGLQTMAFDVAGLNWE